jgi:hypothetical protein
MARTSHMVMSDRDPAMFETALDDRNRDGWVVTGPVQWASGVGWFCLMTMPVTNEIASFRPRTDLETASHGAD